MLPHYLQIQKHGANPNRGSVFTAASLPHAASAPGNFWPPSSSTPQGISGHRRRRHPATQSHHTTPVVLATTLPDPADQPSPNTAASQHGRRHTAAARRAWLKAGDAHKHDNYRCIAAAPAELSTLGPGPAIGVGRCPGSPMSIASVPTPSHCLWPPSHRHRPPLTGSERRLAKCRKENSFFYPFVYLIRCGCGM